MIQRLAFIAIGAAIPVASLTACGASDDEKIAKAVDTACEWTPWSTQTAEENAADLRYVINEQFDGSAEAIVGRAGEKCPDAHLDTYLHPEKNPSIDPEVTDDGPRQYTADSFTGVSRGIYLYTLRELEPRLAGESDETLLQLGAEVCEARSNGNSQENIIELLTSISSWDGMQAARLVTEADHDLC